MIIQLGVHFDTKLHVHKTEHPPPQIKPQQNNKSSDIHIFFSYLFIKSLEYLVIKLPNCRYWTPEMLVPKSRNVGTEVPNGRLYQLPKSVGLPDFLVPS